MKPLVAIVGRPNVGKSMLFNKLCGQRLSIVEDTPGVTRDRLYAQCEWRNRVFDIVDTGGIEPGTDDQILSFMREQAEIAIGTATVIVFVCDIKTGMTASDQEVSNMLLRSGKPVVLAVNKAPATCWTPALSTSPPRRRKRRRTTWSRWRSSASPTWASPPWSTVSWGRSG